MASMSKFYAFVEDLASGVHDLSSDTIKLALSNIAPVSTDAELADITEIGSTGGYAAATVTVTSAVQSAGVFKLIIDPVTFTASGADMGPFQYGVLYNDTSTNKSLIGWFDYGISYTIPDGQPAVFEFDPSTGVFTLQ